MPEYPFRVPKRELHHTTPPVQPTPPLARLRRVSASAADDIWSRWLLRRRFGGSQAVADEWMARLRKVCDRVLHGLDLQPGQTLLDVGAGDGLIAFAALERLGPTGHAILTDISRPLLDHAQRLANELGVASRCSFVEAPAEDLGTIPDGSVDALTTRSVLIYVVDKSAAFREFHRVLAPGGHLSIFEPINRLNDCLCPDAYWGGGIPAIADLAARLRAHYHGLQPPDTDPMLDFDQVDLLRHCLAAGFSATRLQLEVDATPAPPRPWAEAMEVAGNPKIPSLREAVEELFTRDERERFEHHVRPVVEAGGQPTVSAAAYLQATR